MLMAVSARLAGPAGGSSTGDHRRRPDSDESETAVAATQRL